MGPEDVGLSSERLQRIRQAVQPYIDGGQIAGGVTIVARRCRIAHFEAQGVMDVESKKPMLKDSIFRIASMSKPVTADDVRFSVSEGSRRGFAQREQNQPQKAQNARECGEKLRLPRLLDFFPVPFVATF